MSDFLKQALFEGLQGIIGIAITVLLAFIRKKYTEYVNTDTKKKLVSDVVYYIEQVYKSSHGKEKLEKAKSTLSSLLASKNIGFTEEEINVLIESAVNQLNLQQGNSLSTILESANDLTNVTNSIDPNFGIPVESTIEETNDINTEEVISEANNGEETDRE
jgi:hypothetical protein